MVVGFYPGTFDPVTNGHIDIIIRAARVAEKLVIAVAENPGKKPLLTLDERVDSLRELVPVIKDRSNADIIVTGFSGLLVDCMHEYGANVIFRGIRALADFDYEVQMSGVNRQLAGDIETVFLLAAEQNLYTSSSVIKEVALLGGDVSCFLPEVSKKRLLSKLKKIKDLSRGNLSR